MGNQPPGLTYYPVSIARWTFQVTVVRTAENMVYLPVAAICQRLGINEQRQIQKLRDDPEYAPFLALMPVPTSKGTRETWCIKRQAVGGWMASIQSNRVRAEIAPRLAEFRLDVMAAADRCLFGELVQQEPHTERDIAEVTQSLIQHAFFIEGRVGDLEEDLGTLKSAVMGEDTSEDENGNLTVEIDVPIAGIKTRVRVTLAVIRVQVVS